MKFTDADERAFAVLDAVSADIEQQGGRPDSMNVREHEQIKQAIEHLRVRLAADQQKGGGEVDECEECQVSREAHLRIDSILMGASAFVVLHEGGQREAWSNTVAAVAKVATPQPSIPAPAQQVEVSVASSGKEAMFYVLDGTWYDAKDATPHVSRHGKPVYDECAAPKIKLHTDRAGCEWFIVTSDEFPGSESEVTPSDDPALFALLKSLPMAQQDGKASGGEYLFTSEEVDEAIELLRFHRSSIVTEAIDHMEACLRANVDDALAHPPHAEQETQG